MLIKQGILMLDFLLLRGVICTKPIDVALFRILQVTSVLQLLVTHVGRVDRTDDRAESEVLRRPLDLFVFEVLTVHLTVTVRKL